MFTMKTVLLDLMRADRRRPQVQILAKTEGVNLCMPRVIAGAFTSFETRAFWGYHTSQRDSIRPGPPILDNPFLRH